MILIILGVLISHIAALTWEGNIDTFPKSWNVTKITNQQLLSIVNDPHNPNQKAIKIVHPKGSCSSVCGLPNGAGFNVKPFPKATNVYFDFEVFFHSTFNFVRGGKLPGLYGGAGCAGCNKNIQSRENCFSARFMVCLQLYLELK